MDSKDLHVRLWGVRGSYPVPGKQTAKYGGNTSCIEIRARDHIIILDAGTGIINLGTYLLEEIERYNSTTSSGPFVINLFFSHTHHDHIQGLPYFAPAYETNCLINVFGPRTFSQSLKDILISNMAPQYSPIELDELKARFSYNNITEHQVIVFGNNKKDFQLGRNNEITYEPNEDVKVSLLRNYAHPKMGTFVFKVQLNGKSIVYATDTEGYIGGDTRLCEFSKNANLLIHDAQYAPEQYAQTQGYGHSTYEMAARVANAAKVENLVLFHHDPYHDDDKLAGMENEAKKLFANTFAGSEGQEFAF